ncbi:Mmd [Acrasis kona]|uniref:Mmd n=1 Tax=Acrasis kona TaxID=1008807 RepID=A0AAW2Z5Y1_9EUKA
MKAGVDGKGNDAPSKGVLINKSYTPRLTCCGCAFMNTKTPEGYTPTTIEHIMNCLTHAIPALISIYGLYALVKEAEDRPVEKFIAWIYGVTLIMLFSISTVYHISNLIEKLKQFTPILQKLDHAVIFIFIAASYTPWLMLTDLGSSNMLGKWFVVLVWFIAVIGTFRFLFARSHPQFLLLALGWIVVLLANPIYNSKVPFYAMLEVLLGGLFYSFGAILLNMDGIVPFSHALWHIMTTAAAAFHYHSIYTYLITYQNEEIMEITLKEFISSVME